MDPVTHAASGAVAFLAFKNRPATFWTLPLAALAAASPDIDLLFIHTPLEFLQLHRGITHSFACAPFLGLLLALLAWPLWRRATPDRWKFPFVWFFCILMILLHMWLDVVTTYGTMIFLPFSHYRVRFNSIFIVDPLITLPLLWAVWRWRLKRKLILAMLAWVFIYPGVGILANYWHSSQWEARLAEAGKHINGLVVFPDLFSPAFWRVIYQEQTDSGLVVQEQSIDFMGKARAPAERHPAANPAIVRKISLDSLAGDTYFNFAVLPIEQELRPEDTPDQPLPNSRLLMFYDLRFGSGISWVQRLLAMRPNADMPFVLMAEMFPDLSRPADDLKVGRIRLRFSDSGRDSHWHRPLPPSRPNFWEWLVGLN